MNRTKAKMVRLDAKLFPAIKREAGRAGMSIQEYVNRALDHCTKAVRFAVEAKPKEEAESEPAARIS